MEFGIMLIANSHCILLMLTGFKIIKVHDTPRDHALLNGAQKCRIYINNVAMILFWGMGVVLLLFFFLNWFSVFIGFVWKKRLIILTDFINNCLLFYLTVYAFSQTVAMSVIMIMTGLYCELENIGVGIFISIQVYYYINHIKIKSLRIHNL